MGEWAGSSFEELGGQAEWRRFNALRSMTRPPGGELMLETQARVVTELECLRRRHPEQVVAVVSHADVIKAAISHLAGAPLDLFHRIEIAPASVSVVGLDENAVRIQRVNDSGSFEPNVLFSRRPV